MGYNTDIVRLSPRAPTREIVTAAEYLAYTVDKDWGTRNGKTALYWSLIQVICQHAAPESKASGKEDLNMIETDKIKSPDDYKVVIDYTNWRGERSIRVIRPGRLMYATALPWHPEPQWLLEAFDFGRNAYRVFAMQDIHSWYPASRSDIEKVS